jgi:N-acetylglutamate synthase-like GNAT family acetyltransferase
MDTLDIISVREHPELLEDIIAYFQQIWANSNTMAVYDDAIRSALISDNALPQWLVLRKEGVIIGCAGLITNDFISRMDLWPWLCALYIDEAHRHHGYSRILIEHVKKQTRDLGFDHLYLCTDHKDYYEKFGFRFIGTGYHPLGESSSIYGINVKEQS